LSLGVLRIGDTRRCGIGPLVGSSSFANRIALIMEKLRRVGYRGSGVFQLTVMLVVLAVGVGAATEPAATPALCHVA